MTGILIFYPHNPVKPQHGSHLRALQQIQGLLDVSQVCLASTEHTSDTLWPKDLEGVAAKLGVAEISVFERSEWALRNRIWLAITFVPHGCDIQTSRFASTDDECARQWPFLDDEALVPGSGRQERRGIDRR